MKRGKGYFIFLLAVSMLNVKVFAQQDLSAVYAMDRQTLAKNKAAIALKDATLLPAYTALIKDADKALKQGVVSVMEKTFTPPSGDKHDYMSIAPYFWPDPSKADGLPYMRKDGQINPEVKEYKDKDYMPHLCTEISTLALAYYFSGNEMYAAHATLKIRGWFLDSATRMNPNMKYAQSVKGRNDGRGAGLIDSRSFIEVVDAIGLLRNSTSWTKADQQGMQKWFTDFLQWMQTSKNGKDEMNASNNHGVWYDAQVLSYALFVNDQQWVKATLANATKRLDEQMDNQGSFPAEMARTTSLNYSCFVVNAFLKITQLADGAGQQFGSIVTPNGKSMKKAFDFLSPYISQQKVWQGEQIKDFKIEDAFVVLLEGAKRFDCGTCKKDLVRLAGEKADRLKLKLLY